MAAGFVGTELLAVAFDGRFSPVGVTAAPQVASDRGIPAGATPFPEDGTNANRSVGGGVGGGLTGVVAVGIVDVGVVDVGVVDVDVGAVGVDVVAVGVGVGVVGVGVVVPPDPAPEVTLRFLMTAVT